MPDCYYCPDWVNHFKGSQDGSMEAVKHMHDKMHHADHWHEWEEVIRYGNRTVICINSKCGISHSSIRPDGSRYVTRY